MKSSFVDQIHRLGPRALAAVIRRSVLPTEVWLRDGEYRPFVDEFARGCDALAPWFALGHDPRNFRPLDIDAVERMGSFEETQSWSPVWSAARTIDWALSGQVDNARGQFEHTVELIADWPETLAEASQRLLAQIQEAVEHVAEITSGMDDPPVDDDTLMIPAFYVEVRKPPASRKVKAKQRSFDTEVEELIRLIGEGRVAIFCGAGISIASGIPSAKELQRVLLTKLPASELEITRLVENDLPFEAFMEVLSKATDFEPLLEVFTGKEPNRAHVLLADLATRGLVQTIATTNFDELIERAVGSSSIAVTKLHGTISNPRSIAVTMEMVAGRQRLPEREQDIARIFASGDHEAVLVVGYSCSDAFDISPAIEALGDSLKRVWIVEHEPGSERAEEIVAKTWKNPFRLCRNGTRLFWDSGVLFSQIEGMLATGSHTSTPSVNKWLAFFNRWRRPAKTRQPRPASLPGDEWLTFVDKWWSHVTPREQLAVGHYILGQLWYLCADFRAAKVHYRASLAAAGRRPHPATRSNALLQIAGCHRALSEFKRVLERAQEAHRLAITAGEDFLEAQAAGTIGNAWFNMGEIENSVEWYERAVETLRKLGNQRALGSGLANLGNAYGARGDLEKAEKCFREGIELARDLGDKVGEASRMGALAQVLGMLKRGDEAGTAPHEALRISGDMADLPGVAHQLARLAQLEAERGHLDEAIKMASEAAERFSEIGDRQGEARCFGNLGAYYMKIGEVGKAVASFRHSEEIAEKIGDQSALAVARRNLEVIDAAVKSFEQLNEDSEPG